MQTDAPPVSYFGKVPTFADFVRYQASTPVWGALDEWVQRGIQRLGPYKALLRQAADAAQPVSFTFAPDRSETMLLGVLRPSCDQAGRFYPFMLAHEMPHTACRGSDAARLPVGAQPFLEQAARVVEDAAQGRRAYRDLDGARPAVEQAAARLQRPASEHDAYLRETTFKALVESIWGHFDEGGKYVLFKNLLEVLGALRDQPGVRLTYGLVFPLGAGSPARHVVSFWWELCYRMLGDPDLCPTCFWPAPGEDAAEGSLTLFLHPPSPEAFPALLPAETAARINAENDALCELDRVEHGSASEAALAIPPRIGSLIESETITLYDVLQRAPGLDQ